MRSKEEILSLYNYRKNQAGIIMGKMREIQAYYNFDEIILPLPELDDSKRPAVANIMIQGIDQNAARIASVLPEITCPPLKPGFKKSEDNARIRRQALYGWWEQNSINVKMSRRARFLIAYSNSPVILKPDFKRGIPKWEPRNPLASFPGSKYDPDDVTVPDAIFVCQRRADWIEQYYPEQHSRLSKGPGAKKDDMFDCLEYIDDEQYSLFVLGKAETTSTNFWVPSTTYKGSEIETLESIPNKAGICTAVVPGRISLDRPKGQFDDMVGMFEAQAKLTALEIIAVERGVFPRTYAVSNGQSGQVVDITPADPKRGIIGTVKNGDIKDMQLNPGPMTMQIIDRLERAQRLAGGVPSEYGGESGSNIRTDRRGQSVLSGAVDFPIAEAQKMFARSLQEENVRAIAIEKAYFGNQPKSFWVSWKGAKGKVDYTPNIHFETDENHVSYSLPGSDVNGLTIVAGQLVGTGLMSKQSAAENHPLIKDAEQEKDRMTIEGIDAAMLSGLQAQVAMPDSPIPLTAVGKIKRYVAQDKMELEDAIDKVQEEMQRLQARVTSEGQPDTVLPGAPEAQPGITADGQGAQVPESIPEPQPSMQHLTQLLGSLRLGQRQTPQEQAPVG